MKAQLNQILLDKQQKKKTLLYQNNKYISVIYEDVIKHKSIREIHKDLFKVVINPNPVLLAYNVKLAQKAHKLDKGAGEYYKDGLGTLISGLISLFSHNNKSIHVVNEVIRKDESDAKQELLTNSFKENRQSGKIFYICSKHNDCAIDHKPYQGKIYVDAYYNRWDKELVEYIKSHNIQTVQWVTRGKDGPYLITRPNCRHYMTTYNFSEVRKNKYKIPNRKIGPDEYQTPRKASLEYLENKLEQYKMMYRAHPNTELKRLIIKYKLLIDERKNNK